MLLAISLTLSIFQFLLLQCLSRIDLLENGLLELLTLFDFLLLLRCNHRCRTDGFGTTTGQNQHACEQEKGGA